MNDDEYTRITLRIPNGLHAKLSKAGKETSKSMNAEIIPRLEKSLDLKPAINSDEIARTSIQVFIEELQKNGLVISSAKRPEENSEQ